MSKRTRIPKELFETYKAMSIVVGRHNKFLQQTSCMNPEERTMIAMCEISKRLFASDEEFVGFIDEFAIPYFEYMGRAKWKRNEVTDLGFALSLTPSEQEDIRTILEYVAKE